MTGTAIRSTAVVFVALAVTAAAASGQGRGGQPGAPAAAPAQQDFSKVEIKTAKISGSFYTIEGQGGIIGALVGPDGVFLVDSQFAPLTDRIVAAIKQISDGRIRFLVNTHQHPDHTGGNENFAKLGVTLIARDELRARLARPPAAGRGAAPPAAALPMLTYRGGITLHMNGEEVQLIPVPAAHTDGDTMVRFVNADVLMTGDFYRSIQYPNIDRANGGTLNGMIDGLNAVIKAAGPGTRIVPGHGPIVDRAAVTAHRDLLIAARDKVAPMVKQGRSQEEIIAAKPLAEFDSKIQQAGTTGERFLGQLYAELAARGRTGVGHVSDPERVVGSSRGPLRAAIPSCRPIASRSSRLRRRLVPARDGRAGCPPANGCPRDTRTRRWVPCSS
jgi:cyclase